MNKRPKLERIVRQAKKYCIELLTGSRCSSLPFHNLEHTAEVFDNVLKIGINEKITLKELEPVLLMALFHDTGNGEIFKNHERFSIDNALKFLQDKNYPHERIRSKVKVATSMLFDYWIEGNDAMHSHRIKSIITLLRSGMKKR